MASRDSWNVSSRWRIDRQSPVASDGIRAAQRDAASILQLQNFLAVGAAAHAAYCGQTHQVRPVCARKFARRQHLFQLLHGRAMQKFTRRRVERNVIAARLDVNDRCKRHEQCTARGFYRDAASCTEALGLDAPGGGLPYPL